MKLNIGSGFRKYRGYKTIDVEPHTNPEIVGDFRTMKFEDVDEVRAEHLLEHFSREEAIDILKLWNSWLKVGGRLHIEVPDFQGICRDFDIDRYWMTRHAYGSQEAEWAYHKDGWYLEKFKQVLPKCGFKIISHKYTFSRKILPNIVVIAEKFACK